MEMPLGCESLPQTKQFACFSPLKKIAPQNGAFSKADRLELEPFEALPCKVILALF